VKEHEHTILKHLDLRAGVEARHWHQYNTRSSSNNFFHQREGKTIKINDEELYDACGAQVNRIIAQ
jgi:hypothetical protein